MNYYHHSPFSLRRFSRRRSLTGSAALAGIGALALSARGSAPMPKVSAAATPGTPDDDLRVSTAGWTTDFSKHSVNLSEILSGGPPRDGIPPIDHPAYVPIAEADGWLEAK
jgi:hypothetical protein